MGAELIVIILPKLFYKTMKKIPLTLSLLALVTTMFAFQPVMLSAQSIAQTSGDRVQDGLNSIRDTYPAGAQGANEGNLREFVKKILEWALYLAAMVAVIFIVVGGFYYITAGGSDEQAKKGRKTLVNALIGLTLVILSFIIVQVVYRFLVD